MSRHGDIKRFSFSFLVNKFEVQHKSNFKFIDFAKLTSDQNMSVFKDYRVETKIAKKKHRINNFISFARN